MISVMCEDRLLLYRQKSRALRRALQKRDATPLPIGQLIVRLDSQPIVHAPLRMLAVAHVAHGEVACTRTHERVVADGDGDADGGQAPGVR